MEKNFETSLNALLVDLEGPGGDPLDPNPTAWGVTQAVYDRYRDDVKMPRRPVTEMTDEERRIIYYNYYWASNGISKLPDGVDFFVFQAGVNIGPPMAVRLLQRVLGVNEDGVAGPITQNAAAAMPLKTLIDEYAARQKNYYDAVVVSHPDKAWAIEGWYNRIEKSLAIFFKNWGAVAGIGFFLSRRRRGSYGVKPKNKVG